MMNFDLSENQLTFRESAHKFSAQYLHPNAKYWDAEQIFPKDVLKLAGEQGFMGMYVPEKCGGIGLSRLDVSIILEELASGCTSTAAYISIHNMATHMLAKFGNSALVSEYCSELCLGNLLASYCLTEASAGSDAVSLKTTATKEGNYYLLNGSKSFISGAGDTDILVVMARTGEQGSKGISSFVVDVKTEGIGYGKKEEKMGWNSQSTREVNFNNVKVPLECRLGDEGQGFSIAMQGLDGGRINIAACSIGAAKFCLQAATNYSKEREQFGKALNEFQHTQFQLADMYTELVAARQMVQLAAVKLDNNQIDKTAYCAMAKRFATDIGFKICNQALQIHGGYGYIKEYSIERYVRDTRVHQILEGTNEIMRLIISRALINESINL